VVLLNYIILLYIFLVRVSLPLKPQNNINGE